MNLWAIIMAMYVMQHDHEALPLQPPSEYSLGTSGGWMVPSVVSKLNPVPAADSTTGYSSEKSSLQLEREPDMEDDDQANDELDSEAKVPAEVGDEGQIGDDSPMGSDEAQVSGMNVSNVSRLKNRLKAMRDCKISEGDELFVESMDDGKEQELNEGEASSPQNLPENDLPERPVEASADPALSIEMEAEPEPSEPHQENGVAEVAEDNENQVLLDVMATQLAFK